MRGTTEKLQNQQFRGPYCLRHRIPPKVFPVTAVFFWTRNIPRPNQPNSERSTHDATILPLGRHRPLPAESPPKISPISAISDLLPKFDEFSHSGDNRKVASLQHVGLWRSWERASMAWKRSSVRSRSGPPINPFILRYLPTPTRRGLVSRGCGRVLKFLNFQRQL